MRNQSLKAKQREKKSWMHCTVLSGAEERFAEERFAEERPGLNLSKNKNDPRLENWFKARGWWPLSRSSTKVFFWRFVFLWVNLALLNPIERFSWRVCVVQATKKEEESCSFLDAIGRRSCGPLSRLTKNRQVGKPKLRLNRIKTAGDSWSVRNGTLSHSPLTWHVLQLTFESSLSLLCMHVVRHATESEVHASGKFCSISDPPPPPLSLRVTRFEKKNHFR